jgi:hypothetical protein
VKLIMALWTDVKILKILEFGARRGRRNNNKAAAVLSFSFSRQIVDFFYFTKIKCTSKSVQNAFNYNKSVSFDDLQCVSVIVHRFPQNEVPRVESCML